MKENFERFLTTGDEYGQLTEALYAYQTMEMLCVSERRQQKDHGAKCFKMALDFIALLHEELAKKLPQFQADQLPADIRLRFGELRIFFSRHVFSDFIIAFITHLGAGQMASFVQERLLGLELREFGGVLVDLAQQRTTVRNVRGSCSLIKKLGGKIPST